MHPVFKTLTAVAVSAFALSACNAEHTHSGEGIEISNARINPPLPGQTTAVAFMRLDNHGDDDRLLSISTPASGRVELHTHTEDGGVMKMRRVEGIALPHGETIDLKPGSYHVMMFDADAALGDETVLTLDFETAEDLTIVAPIIMRGTLAEDKMNKGDMDHGSHTKK